MEVIFSGRRYFERIKIRLCREYEMGGKAVREKDGGRFERGETSIEIDVRNVTMQFRRAKDEAVSIKETLVRTLRGKREYEFFKALDDVSFSVEKGQIVGIMGTNG